jgi:beta-xylosidase
MKYQILFFKKNIFFRQPFLTFNKFIGNLYQPGNWQPQLSHRVGSFWLFYLVRMGTCFKYSSQLKYLKSHLPSTVAAKQFLTTQRLVAGEE